METVEESGSSLFLSILMGRGHHRRRHHLCLLPPRMNADFLALHLTIKNSQNAKIMNERNSKQKWWIAYWICIRKQPADVVAVKRSSVRLLLLYNIGSSAIYSRDMTTELFPFLFVANIDHKRKRTIFVS
jgi:hypothetical protein